MNDIEGIIFAGGTFTALARIVDDDGAYIKQADISTITYTIYQLGDTDTAVTNHTDVSILAADVIYDTLQTAAIWDKDVTGFNFKHCPDIRDNPAFASAGKNYRVVYKITPTEGQIVIVRFKVSVV